MSEIDTAPPGGVRSAAGRSSTPSRSATPRPRRNHPSTSGAVVTALADRRPAREPAPGDPDDQPERDGEVAPGPRIGRATADAVVPLNEAAAVYDALAEQIQGSAVGWSAQALAQLEQGLLARYGPVIGGRHAVRRLVRLAARPPAA